MLVSSFCASRPRDATRRMRASQLVLRSSVAAATQSLQPGLHKTQNIKKNKKNKTNKTYYTEPGKCCICVFFFPPAGFLAVTYNDT